jgi:hypothetical protein
MIKAILPVPALACGYRNVRVQTQCKRCGEARGIGALAFDKQGRRIGFLWGSEKITFTRLPSQDPNDDD